MQNQFWNERFSEPEYSYGTEPNVFLKEELVKIPKGKILFPCEGEGRNAVFAAKLGWEVTSFDFSDAGQKKALDLAAKNGVSIDYQISDATAFQSSEQFDVIAFIYAHFPAEIRQKVYNNLVQYLKPNGKIIFEVFNKNQLGNPSGGPKDIDMLLDIATIKQDFPDFKFEYLAETQTVLHEGAYHEGKADVLRAILVKMG